MSRDPDLSVRREVELALEKMDDIRALPGFIQLASDSERDIRARAVTALIALHLPRGGTLQVPLLTKLTSSFNKESDLDVVMEPDVPLDPSVIATLRDRLTDQDPKIRRQAAWGLGILRADAGIPELLFALRQDSDGDVRFESVRALRKIGVPSVGESLTPVLFSSDDRVRNEVIATLGSFRYRPAVPDLTKLFEQTKPGQQLRVQVLSALADIGDPASAEIFRSLSADKDENIRLYANEGLARLADPAMKSEISTARLREKNSGVQLAQAFALLRMGQVEYMDDLVRGLGSTWTRQLAREYLFETLPAQRPQLFTMYPDSAPARAELAHVFGFIGDREALPALSRFAHDPDRTVAETAQRAIRWINAPSRVD